MAVLNGEIEGAVRRSLHADANAVRLPQGLVERIMHGVRSESSSRSFADRIARLFNSDAEQVRSPRDMQARVREAIRGHESRRIRFNPAALAGPAAIAACIIGVIALVSILPRTSEDEGEPASLGQQGPVDGGVPAGGEQALSQSLPPGAAAPAFVPEGYELVGFEQAASATSPLTYRLEDGEGGYIVIQQAALAGPSANEAPQFDAFSGDRDRSGGYSSSLRVTNVHGESSVTFVAGDFALTITANQLSDQDLLRVARSVKFGP
jgi:hypothetical protein